MKKAVMVLSFLFLFSTVGFASPLLDFSKGKTAIDLSWRPSSDFDSGDISADGKNNNFDFGLTVGLGNRFALQWLNQSAKSKDFYDVYNATLTANQFNLLYSLDKNVAAFVGYTRTKNDVGIYTYETLNGKTISGWQAGLTGSVPLGDKFSGYGTVGVGNKITSYEAGVAYEFAKNLEVNLFYKYAKYKDLEFNYDILNYIYGSYDLKVKGPGIGVTYKF